MISACILFVFASGYGVATKECRHDYGYHPPSEVVHVVGDNLSTPPHMVIITPPVSYVYRWSHPTYQVNRRYVDSQYLVLNPVIIGSLLLWLFSSRVRTRTYNYSPRRTVKRPLESNDAPGSTAKQEQKNQPTSKKKPPSQKCFKLKGAGLRAIWLLYKVNQSVRRVTWFAGGPCYIGVKVEFSVAASCHNIQRGTCPPFSMRACALLSLLLIYGVYYD